MSNAAQQPVNKRLIGVLLGLAVAMFGFGFALVPLYNIFCEITGINGRVIDVDQTAAVQANVVDTSRTITIQFDSSIERGLPWEFAPNEKFLKVHPGEMMETSYRASSHDDDATTGHAAYSVAPGRAGLYFTKTECFCFTQQTLQAGETRDMPVRFRVASDIPEDVKTLTLSYRFYPSKTSGDSVAQNSN